MTTPWPPLHAYALAHRCTTCRAEPGEPCNAPGKQARLDAADRFHDELGVERGEHDPAARLHAARLNAGSRHYSRDVGRAPWADERVPGRRYDSLPNWQPEGP